MFENTLQSDILGDEGRTLNKKHLIILIILVGLIAVLMISIIILSISELSNEPDSSDAKITDKTDENIPTDEKETDKDETDKHVTDTTNDSDKKETDTTQETDTTYVTDKQETDTTDETDTTYVTDKQETDTTIETDTTYVTDKQETDTTIETDTTYDTDKQETDTTDETDQYDTDSTDESDKEEEEPSDYVGKIKAIYEVSTSNSTINILGERSNIDSSKIKIYINDTEIPFTKKYYFKSPETCTIIFELMNELNLNHIFHNIPEIISVEITSSNDKHQFGLTSMKNAFYKSPNLQNVSVSNVKFLDDMSYAFAEMESCYDEGHLFMTSNEKSAFPFPPPGETEGYGNC